MLALSIKVPTI